MALAPHVPGGDVAFWIELFVILGLILVSGVFAGAEIALLSVRKTRLGEMAVDGRRGAAAALKLRQDPERLLATIQVAITVTGAATAVLGGAHLAEPLAAVLTQVGVVPRYASTVSFIVVVSGISYFSLVFGELVPKSIALRHSEGFAVFISRLLVLLSRTAKPAVWLLTFSSNAVLRLFGDSTSFTESRLSPEELQQLVEEASSSGSLAPAAGEIASRALQLGDLRVKDVMIPRQRVIAIPCIATQEEVRETLRDKPHSRYPVYDTTLDELLGYVTARELYEALAVESFDVRRLVRPVVFVPEMTGAVEALRLLQQERQRLGLVVDETGGIVGAVAIADVAEVLIGEMLDENEAPSQLVISEQDDAYLVRGDAPIHELERELNVTLANGNVRASTVAGLVIEELGRIPTPGTRVNLGPHVEAEVVDASARRIRTLRLRRISSHPDQTTAVV